MDGVSGGEGIDTPHTASARRTDFSLDGLANDGAASENDLIGVDVEDIEARRRRGDHVRRRWSREPSDGHQGRAVITGGEGVDVLEGGWSDDTLHARDGCPTPCSATAGSTRC